MVLNALSIDPRRAWKGPWRWFHEQMLDCCEPLSQVLQTGIVLDQVFPPKQLQWQCCMLTDPVLAHHTIVAVFGVHHLTSHAGCILDDSGKWV